MSTSTSSHRRLAVLTTAAAGVPAAAWAIHPALSAAISAVEAAAGLTVVATALYGCDRHSERAFRLLRWITDRPEPPTYPHQ
ncbi:hypothetical protein OG589_32795 [Sphaerisporangium sp. NBC_01403]|uniref:hypothetical protein n=1 Tax=Sphaerisporangium sp. NBC_01403 TaxID=2903599 RepID=UPI00324C6074